jgi:hypothetical protein
MKEITIGLFGTCGSSKWRDKFISIYESRGINYFNPVKEDWKPEDAQIEAEHLANDDIICFPVTHETYAFGSLGEVGFSILQAIKMDQRRDIIIMINPEVEIEKTELVIGSGVFMAPSLVVDAQTKDSIKMRALVMAHLRKINYPNVYIVNTLKNMLDLSMYLHAIQVLKEGVKQYTI